MIKDITVRFFTYAFVENVDPEAGPNDDRDFDLELVEVTENSFLELKGPVEYARNRVAENGVRQISLLRDTVDCYPHAAALDLAL